ncbi:MAG: hypothetical protein ACK4P3_07415 [Fimbriimonadaceae bacterium]
MPLILMMPLLSGIDVALLIREAPFETLGYIALVGAVFAYGYFKLRWMRLKLAEVGGVIDV